MVASASGRKIISSSSAIKLRELRVTGVTELLHASRFPTRGYAFDAKANALAPDIV